MIDHKKLVRHMYDVIGAIHEVHRELGPGLNEYCYQEGLEMELQERGIEYQRELTFHPLYHSKEMKAEYRLDFLCKGDIIVELKAVESLGGDNKAQLFNYMRLRKAPCGIIVNFAPKFAEIERYLYDAEKNEILTTEGKPLFRNICDFE